MTASNGHGGSASMTFNWTITDTDRAPILANPGNQSSPLGSSVSLQLQASSPDNNTLTFDATGLPSGLSIDSSSGLISSTPDASALSTTPYAITVTATDGILTATQTFNWTVTAANQTPLMTSPGNQVNATGDVVSLALTGSDSDGDNLTWTATGLPAGLTIDPSSGTISGTPASSAASATPYNVVVTASDGITSASTSFTWTINYVGITSPGDQANVNGDVVSLPLAASSASGALSYSASNLPAGLTIDPATGIIGGTLSNTADASSPYATTITASDGTHSTSTSFNWTVTHLSVTNPGDQVNLEATAVSLQLQGSDSDGDSLTWTATGLPSGLTITSGGLISGTLAALAHGSSPYQVTLTASDGTHSASQSFVWTVTPRVALVNPGGQTNALGDSVSVQVQASTVGGTLTYSASNLPPGLVIAAATGLISGTIASNASSTPYAVTVTVSDGTSSNSQTFLWAVTPIALLTPGDQTNLDGDAISLPLTTHHHGTGTLSFSATGLPAGLSINSSTGAISGAVANTADTSGPYSVTVTATDGVTSSSQTFNWIINQRVSLDAVADQNNAAGDIVSLPLSASDFTATVNWGDGNSDTGTVQGGPGNFTVTDDHNYLEAGSYPLSVVITAFGGTTTTVASTATVADAPLAVTGGFDLGALKQQSSALRVATFTDGNAAATADVSASINWGDGTGTTAGTISFGPGGLGSVSGTHNYAQNGNYTVTVTLTDVKGATATTTSTVTVGDTFAGVSTTLNLSSFLDANGAAPASDFMAMVNWGDGSSPTQVTVTGSNGTYTLPSVTHTYATDSLSQPGGVYTVTVMVGGDGGSMLTGTGTVTVVRPAMTLNVTDNLETDANLTVTNARVASFTEPDVTDSSSEFSAVIFWGDGTSSSGMVVGAAGLYDVLGSHTYAATDDYYVIQVQVFQHWDAVFLAAEAEGMGSAPYAPSALVGGAKTVPGMSEYTYFVNISKPGVGIPDKEISNVKWIITDPASLVMKQTRSDFGQTGRTRDFTTALGVKLQFKNQPGRVLVQLQWDRTVGGKTTTYKTGVTPVDIVQVKVNKSVSGNNPFTANSSPIDGGSFVDPQTIDGQFHRAWPYKIVRSARAGQAAIEWKADVTLVPPPGRPNAVNKIQVGFIQYTQFVTRRVYFATAKKYLVSSLVNGKKYIDVAMGLGPFYTSDRDGIVDGGRDGKTKTISTDDTPSPRFPLQRLKESAARADVLDRFWLYVAARTTDGANSANDHYFSLASAEWSFNGSGKIGSPFAMPIPGPWTAIRNVTGVFPPSPNQWTVSEGPPVELSPSGITANKAQETLGTIWTSKDS